MRRVVRRNDLLYPDESYQIVGVLFDVFNELGPGHHERYYQRAIRESLRQREIPFREQVHYPLRYRGATVGRQYVDFIVFDKIVLEIKKGGQFSKRHIEQVLSYPKASGYRLALLANFSRNGITSRRIVNFG